MKIVLDSNIFVSSFFWGGNPRKVFDRVTNGLDELFITDDILKEIKTVMSRKKFDADIKKVENYINIIESYSVKIFCKNVAEEISRDRDDNKILQCGLEGDVDFIITGDEDLLILKNYRNIKIINSKDYVNIVKDV
jgi:putative PIN family toxin of toxin-antitoxin system